MKLSIVIPTYNRATFIKAAIESVLRQPTVEDIEVIVVDDGSTDNTKDIVLGFKDKRIIYERFEKNKGVNFARNKGIQLSSGEWIGYLDSDDQYIENIFSTVLEVLDGKAKNMDVVGFMTVGEYGKKSGYLKKGNWDFVYPTYEDVLFKKNISGDINHFIKKRKDQTKNTSNKALATPQECRLIYQTR